MSTNLGFWWARLYEFRQREHTSDWIHYSPSLKNLSLEEEANNNENKATLWEASVARNVMMTPRASSPYLKWTSMLEDLESNTDDDIIDVTNYSERPTNDKRSPQSKQAVMTQGHCPTPQNSPTYLPMNAAAAPAKPHRTEIWGILPDKRKLPCGWPACLRRQPPRATLTLSMPRGTHG